MKAYLWIPPFFLLGILIGGWGPRESLRELGRGGEKKEREATRKPVARLDNFTHLANIPDEASPRRRGRVKTTNTVTRAATQNIALTNRAERTERETPSRVAEPRDLAARIDQAKELWQTRMEIAHAQWVQRLALDEPSQSAFDTALNAMNERLYLHLEAFAGEIENGAEMTEEAIIKGMNAFTAILAETYDQLAAVLPVEKRGEIAEISLSDFIDPGVVEPLIAVEDKFGSAMDRRKNRKSGR
ncbi:MAG: hypothetical protein J6Z49_05645 [Kiritimatiellae bacterium]|nr:hypothetical protein [Kiritimatiellia bacterium]